MSMYGGQLVLGDAQLAQLTLHPHSTLPAWQPPTTCSSEPTAGYAPNGPEISLAKRHLHPHIHAALFTTAKRQKQPTCPQMDEWIQAI